MRLGICGDGEINLSREQCDDGNNTSGDGCSAICEDETKGPFCGDGEVNLSREQCDDGNTSNEDLCDTTCQVIPEFGTIAMMIFGVAITSIIALTFSIRKITKF